MAYLNINKADLQLEKRIGVGGFSAVFQAKWNGQLVAAKRLNEPDQHEVEVLSKLDHPNIVRLIGICHDNFDQYLVLELCSGGSLRSYLDQQRSQKKCLPTRLVLDWAKQAAKPIQYLNQMKIVHKDVKSPNYLIAEGNVLKLADFGLAKNIEFTIKNATDRASHPWMAPELAQGILSPSYDIHAYGVVVWELCTSEFPFEGSEPHHIIWRVCNNGERPVIPPDCPKRLADLMRQCWEKDWKKRPSIDHILMVLTSAETKFNLTNGSWVFEKEFGQNEPGNKMLYASGAAVSRTGQVMIVDRDIARIQVYSATGQHQLSIDTTQGLMPGTRSQACNVAVSPEGDYYVADMTRFIKTYDSSGMFKDKWVAVSPDNKPSDTEDTVLVGLTMDSKGHLLVGECQQKYISTHRQNRTHIVSIKVSILPHFLAVTSQHTIIVSGAFDHEVQIVDNTGNVLHILRPPSHVTSWNPWGVCCYEDIIFICNWDLSHNRIYCFSASGEYLRSIDTKKIPRYIAIGNDRLYVAHRLGVDIYSCK